MKTENTGSGQAKRRLQGANPTQGAPATGADAPPEAAGLVNTETSVTLYPHKARLKRMRRSVITTARLIQEELQHGGRRFKVAMITLTYRPEAEWSKKHVTQCIKAIREYLRRRGYPFRYVWVLENTKAGKPHYHLLVWLPRGVSLPKPDKRGWWAHGWTRIEWARNPVGYLAKYASKGASDDEITSPFPKGARLHGSGGLTQRARIERAWLMAPSWVKEAVSAEDRPVRAPGGGWASKVTGTWLPSPWRLVDRASNWVWLRFEKVPEAPP